MSARHYIACLEMIFPVYNNAGAGSTRCACAARVRKVAETDCVPRSRVPVCREAQQSV